MSQKTRILIVVGVLVLIAVALGVFGTISQSQTAQMPVTTPQPWMIHLYVDGAFTANLLPSEMQKLGTASFVDKEQNKTQSGYWLKDVIRAYVKESALSPTSQIIVTGVRQGTEKKSATLTWAEVLDPANNVLFSPSNDGTSVKIAASLERLSTRNDWVQGLTQIDVKTKP